MFFRLRETLSYVKTTSDEQLRDLLSTINNSIERYLESKQVTEEMMLFLEKVIDLAAICGEIIVMEVCELLSNHVCERITSLVQAHLNNWNCGTLVECESFPLVIIILI